VLDPERLIGIVFRAGRYRALHYDSTHALRITPHQLLSDDTAVR
jgi:hypothetical protein